MRALLEERLRPLVRTACLASGVMCLALLVPALFIVPLSRQSAVIVGVIPMLGVLVIYAADLACRNARAAAAAALDRELIPAGIANSLDALRDVELLRSFIAGAGGCSLAQAARTANDEAEDLVRGRETLDAMSMSHAAIESWRVRHEPFMSRRQHAERVAAHVGAIARAGSIALQIGVLALGVWLVAESRISVVVLAAAALVIGRAMYSLEQLIGSYQAMNAARGAWQRLNRRAPCIVVKQSGAPAGGVELDRVSYTPSAGRRASVRNVSLSLALGESILIAGPSGSGKTTLARLIAGVLRPQAGRVSRDDSVGYVSQEIRLFPGTIAANIACMGPLDSTRIVQAARLAHVHEMIVQLPESYHTEVCEGGACLSAGQRRRIALARALYADPRLLVLDEPTADLDVDGELALVKTLAALKERGTTVVIVGQRTGELAHVDQFAILREGVLQTFERTELPTRAGAVVVPLQRPAPQPL
ncbi:MAG TPA: ATP-binding cassette domain-containing protein [Steroidobacteraceae bacterium]|nr:ATP-binding cassette domain-containing protein [Steroidobacteraceae bacterium]